MEINWNFNEIKKEIERVKNIKPRTTYEKASKYIELETLSDLLFARTANDRELENQLDARKSISFVNKYLDQNKSTNKNIIKKFNHSSKEALLKFMKLTENHTLNDTMVDVNNPLINEYINKLTIDDIIKIGNDFFNTVPFVDKNVITKTVDDELISITNSTKTIYTANVGKLYTTNHILATYRDDIYLNTLIDIIRSYALSKDLFLEKNHLDRKLKIDNIFVTFFPKLMELLSYDFILEKSDNFNSDINLSKYKLLNNYNYNLKSTLFYLNNPSENVINIPKELINESNLDNEKIYYDLIIKTLEDDLSTPQSINQLKVLKEKIKNPISFIPPILGDYMSYKYPLASYSNYVLNSGTHLLSTLLSLKFYYLIKEDKEKGLALLEKVYKDLIINNKDSAIILKRYGLEDYLTPDYIEQYNKDYELETSVSITR